MKAEDRYLKFVRWSDEEGLYVGFWERASANDKVTYSGLVDRTVAGLARASALR